MDTETEAPPTDPALFDRAEAALAADGPLKAVDALIADLMAAENFQAVFYAKLMRKRVELGVSPFPTGPSDELPEASHEAYENAIREAGRCVGNLYLERRDFAKAWGFYRMLGEQERMFAALDKYEPAPDDDTYGIVEIAWQHGVHPQKGFDILLGRSGVCSAITMVGSADLSKNPDLREYCVKKLVRALHEQLKDRIRGDLDGRNIAVPADATIPQMIAAGGPELFGEDAYHIDVSHLSSVVQLAAHLSKCAELDLAGELCTYGVNLSPNLRGDMPAPFDGGYTDYAKYLDILAGRNVDANLAHFRAKLDEAAGMGDTFPAEVLVNLLLRIDRLPEALAVAKQYLTDPDIRDLSCPTVSELARRSGDFATFAEASRSAADPVNFLAGLIAARKK
jgi:hypothetical protein